MSYDSYLAHHGIKGMHWGVRRYKNTDGSLTEAGKQRQETDSVQKGKNRTKKILLAVGAVAITSAAVSYAYHKKIKIPDETWRRALKVNKDLRTDVRKSEKALNKAHKHVKKQVRLRKVTDKYDSKIKAAIDNYTKSKVIEKRRNAEQKWLNETYKRDSYLNSLNSFYKKYGEKDTNKMLNEWARKKNAFRKKPSQSVHSTKNFGYWKAKGLF